jgi:tetratricopeptide (TPR) repeat protein
MMRMALLFSLLLGSLASAQPSARRVAVAPFQELSVEVPPRAGPRVTARLLSELRAAQGLELAEPALAEPAPDALAQAREAVKEATALWHKRDFANAEAALGRALAAYATVAAALPHGHELADAHALRAVLRYAQGQDEEAARVLSSALALSPGRRLPLAGSSALFAREVERVHKALQAQPRGSVRFVPVPPGVSVTLDGQPVGPAPLRVVEVPPGLHHWRAVLPSGEAAGGLVEVVSGKEAEARVKPPGEGPGAVLAAALAGNRLDTEAMEAATALSQSLKADLLVLGTVSRTETGLALDAFLFAPGARTPRRLPRMALDMDLLDAGPPLRQLAATLAAQGAEAGTPAPVPVAPAEQGIASPRLLQVKYPVQELPASAPPPPPPAQSRPPLTPRKPLVRP